MLDFNNSRRNSSNIFSLAVTVGFLMFLATYDQNSEGSGVKGFFIGLTATIGVHLVLVALGALKSPAVRAKPSALSGSSVSLDQSVLPENVSITREEDESGVTIQIHVSKANEMRPGKSQWTS